MEAADDRTRGEVALGLGALDEVGLSEVVEVDRLVRLVQRDGGLAVGDVDRADGPVVVRHQDDALLDEAGPRLHGRGERRQDGSVEG